MIAYELLHGSKNVAYTKVASWVGTSEQSLACTKRRRCASENRSEQSALSRQRHIEHEESDVSVDFEFFRRWLSYFPFLRQQVREAVMPRIWTLQPGMPRSPLADLNVDGAGMCGNGGSVISQNATALLQDEQVASCDVSHFELVPHASQIAAPTPRFVLTQSMNASVTGSQLLVERPAEAPVVTTGSSASCMPSFMSSSRASDFESASGRGRPLPNGSVIERRGELIKMGRTSGMQLARYYVLRDHTLFVYN